MLRSRINWLKITTWRYVFTSVSTDYLRLVNIHKHSDERCVWARSNEFDMMLTYYGQYGVMFLHWNTYMQQEKIFLCNRLLACQYEKKNIIHKANKNIRNTPTERILKGKVAATVLAQLPSSHPIVKKTSWPLTNRREGKRKQLAWGGVCISERSILPWG